MRCGLDTQAVGASPSGSLTASVRPLATDRHPAYLVIQFDNAASTISRSASVHATVRQSASSHTTPTGIKKEPRRERLPTITKKRSPLPW